MSGTQADPQTLIGLLEPIGRFDFEGYLDMLESLGSGQVGFSMQQAALASRKVAERLVGRPLEPGDEEILGTAVAERHARMLAPEMVIAVRLLVRELVAPGTGLDKETMGAALLYPVVLAALGSALDELHEESG